MENELLSSSNVDLNLQKGVQDTVLGNSYETSDSGTAASIGPPPGFETKGKYLISEETSSALAPDLSDPFLQTMISRAALNNKVISSPQDDLYLLEGENARLWKEHFAPKSATHKAIQVPLEWTNFIISTLITPDRYEWAKGFLTSGMWYIIIQGSESSHTYSFVIPDKCLSVTVSPCEMQAILEEDNSVEPTFSTSPVQDILLSSPSYERTRFDNQCSSQLEEEKGKGPTSGH